MKIHQHQHPVTNSYGVSTQEAPNYTNYAFLVPDNFLQNPRSLKDRDIQQIANPYQDHNLTRHLGSSSQ